MLRRPRLTVAALVLAGAGLVLQSGPAQATPTIPTATPVPTISPAPTASPIVVPTLSPTPTTSPSATPLPPSPVVPVFPAKMILPGAKTAIPWPAHGRARLSLEGFGELGHSGRSTAAPIASVTKVMTAYLVLRDHPLAGTHHGPPIIISAAEAAAYPKQQARGESLVKVKRGERITERQALQALLLASANNMAAILARWDAGSVRAFVKKMNKTAAELGMTSTHYADASGLSASSRSTTADLLKLAPNAMADPAFRQIVAQSSARIPLNKIKNTNRLLGRNGVIGMKTGSTHAAGGCLLFAVQGRISGHHYTIYGTVLGAPGPRILTHAFASSNALIVAARKSIRSVTLIPAGRIIATQRNTDGTVTNFTLRQDLTVFGWSGLTFKLSLAGGRFPGQAPTALVAQTGSATFVASVARSAQS